MFITFQTQQIEKLPLDYYGGMNISGKQQQQQQQQKAPLLFTPRPIQRRRPSHIRDVSSRGFMFMVFLLIPQF